MLKNSLPSRQRTVAVTIDDLPVNSLRNDVTTQTTITRKLLQAIKVAPGPRDWFRERK